jgi:hypothetical protein
MSKTAVGTMQVKEIADVLNNVGAGLHKKTFIDADAATLTLTAEDSGKTIFLNRATGCEVTLPDPEVGLTFHFVVRTAVTSNDYSINGAETTHLFAGRVLNMDTDSSNVMAYFTADESDDDVMSLNGSTTGGLKGDNFTVTCISPTRWYVEGLVTGTGTVATPFA